MTEGEPERQPRSMFAPLLSYLDKLNTETFVLPVSIRDYFDGVAMDEDGHFVQAIRNNKK